MKQVVLLALVGMAIVVNAGGQTPSLETDLREVGLKIREAEIENAKFSGGLVKSLIEARIQILKQTEAMLDQRRLARSSNVTLSYSVDGKAFTVSDAARESLPNIEAEIARLDTQLSNLKREAAKYAGGLVLALTLSTAAQVEQTKAMLEQRRLSIVYGLPQYALPGMSAPATDVTATTDKPNSDPVTTKPLLEIIDIDARVTESNPTFSRLAWKLTVRNPTAAAHSFDAVIEFQDKDGFTVDSDMEYNLVINPGEEKVFNGDALIRAESVGKMAKTVAKVSVRR